jgi:hypothetical protein
VLSAGNNSLFGFEFEVPRARTFTSFDFAADVPVPPDGGPTAIPAPLPIDEPCEEDPKLMLRWSDDGGHTWSNEITTSIGKVGEFSSRVVFRRLGRSRDRVYELKITDPVKVRFISALIDVTPGRN